MCLTLSHEYGYVITEEERMYSLATGLTERERESLFRNMSQVFDNVISVHMSFNHDKEITLSGKVPIPVNKEYAKYMILVAEHYLKSHG